MSLIDALEWDARMRNKQPSDILTTPSEEYWKKLDGSLIAVGDMTHGHLQNILRMILRARRKANIVDNMLDDEYSEGNLAVSSP